jgi:transcriptional regulator with XRE-family HTH domain
MVTKDIPINNEMLAWARKEARLSLDAAAKKAKIGETRLKESFEILKPSIRLERWEQNNGKPSYTQLVQLAKAYKRPILTFFLSAPPKKEVSLVD